jgi:hypothetical protein
MQTDAERNGTPGAQSSMRRCAGPHALESGERRLAVLLDRARKRDCAGGADPELERSRVECRLVRDPSAKKEHHLVPQQLREDWRRAQLEHLCHVGACEAFIQFDRRVVVYLRQLFR